MPEQWTVLEIHGVENIPSLVQKLLTKLPGENFQDHMEARRIRKIEFRHIPQWAMLVETSDEQGFDIALSFDGRSIEEWLVSIGHELGHTFAYGIELSLPLRLLWRLSPCFTDPEEEEFCDLFGAEWAAFDGGHPELRTILQSYLEKSRDEILNERNGLRHLVFDFEIVKN